jgi:Uma2 family endonuclease
VPLAPAPPFWVLEYVSKDSERKDYTDRFRKYERELKVPYYLVFYPEDQK